MAWQAVSCPGCGREVSYLFSLESAPGKRLCAECIREHKHHQGGAPQPRQKAKKSGRAQVVAA